ncbi:unnamed protein product [Camellia sinensis]
MPLETWLATSISVMESVIGIVVSSTTEIATEVQRGLIQHHHSLDRIPPKGRDSSKANPRDPLPSIVRVLSL